MSGEDAADIRGLPWGLWSIGAFLSWKSTFGGRSAHAGVSLPRPAARVECAPPWFAARKLPRALRDIARLASVLEPAAGRMGARRPRSPRRARARGLRDAASAGPSRVARPTRWAHAPADGPRERGLRPTGQPA